MRKILPNKPCKNCSIEFQPTSKDMLYCCKQCCDIAKIKKHNEKWLKEKKPKPGKWVQIWN